MDQQAQPAPANKKRILGFFLFALIVAAIAAGVIVWLIRDHDYVRTSDAYVEGNQVVITPLIDGFITSICTDDTYLVQQGEPIVSLDRTDALIALNEAKANLGSAVRQVCQIYHNASAYEYEMQMKRAELIRSQEFFMHRSEVLNSGAISLEDYQTAVANYEADYNAYQQLLSLYQKEVALIQGKSIRSNPIVVEAVDRFNQAWVNLSRCQIAAPVEGLVAQRSAQVGKWVESGESLMVVIPLDQIWVNANFKETQMKRMKIGQEVKLYADMYGKDVVYHGTIVGLPGGAGNAFSILPPQNLSGNWIKIVQRLPVRVVIDREDIARYPLRIGMTMRAIVDTRDQADSYFQTLGAEAPSYETDIFQKELKGASCVSAKIFQQNLDPSLVEYAQAPYYPLNVGASQ